MRGLLAAALLGAVPARSQQAAPQSPTQTQIRQALPPDVQSRLPTGGDLGRAMQGLNSEDKRRAAEALAGQEARFGNDPQALSALGQAYVSLGDAGRAGAVAERLLAADPRDGDGLWLKGRALQAQGDLRGALAALSAVPPGHPMAGTADAWRRQVQQDLERDGRSPGGFAPVGLGSGPSGAAADPALGRMRQRIQGVIAANQSLSPELHGALSDAGGFSVAQLRAAGINFVAAKPEQHDAVQLTENPDHTFTVAIRADALSSNDARAAANIGNGIRQAQTDRDHPLWGWAINVARGWHTSGQIHKELAANDIDPRPSNPSDAGIMIQRTLLDQKTVKYNKDNGTLGTDDDSKALTFLNMTSGGTDVDGVFARFVNMTGRGNKPQQTRP